MKNIKIYIISHKKAYFPPNAHLIPLQVGACAAKARLEGAVYDDDGRDNLSRLNAAYCELTGLYWMWKNDTSDYVGLFHYRRYLTLKKRCFLPRMNDCQQFYYGGGITDRFIRQMGFDGKEERFIRQFDIIIPQCSNLKRCHMDSFYDLYKRAGYQKELDYTISVLLKKYPECKKYVDMCKNGSKGYHCNMFIMKRDLFEEYCEWLFLVIDEIYDTIKKIDTEVDKPRLIGYIAEFLTGVFMIRKKESCVIREVPGVFFEYTDGKMHYLKCRVLFLLRYLYRILVPIGSRRQKAFRRVMKTLHVKG